MQTFIPGIQLSEAFFREAVQPLIEAHWPGMAFFAARLDFGSDVLGFDTPQSRDHGWGPMLTLYLMANQWRRIDQEEPFMARCGDVGDGLGSRIVAMRLVDNLMRLCFLIERRYALYIKWFGTAFARLSCARRLLPVFRAVMRSERWKQREEYLSTAYRVVMRMHNDLGVTPPIEPEVGPFHNRPYRVPRSERFVETLHAAIRSETVKCWPRHIGAVWQFCDSTDVLDSIERCKTLTGTYSIGKDTT